MEITKKGNTLEITMDEEDIENIIEAKENNKSIDAIWAELFYDSISSLGNNSDYAYWSPGSIMHEYTGSLTNSPLITIGAVLTDQGDITSVDELYWLPNYAVYNEFDSLPTIVWDGSQANIEKYEKRREALAKHLSVD